MKNVIVVNNRDSFVFNLMQILSELDDINAILINEKDVLYNESIIKDASHILLSPGPNMPFDFKGLMTVIDLFHKSHSILGVCLGMQAIAYYFGCKLERLQIPKHGHRDKLLFNMELNCSIVLKDIQEGNHVGRYHSWIVSKNNIPQCIQTDAYDQDGNIMSIYHKKYNLYGLQFHPESIMTENGDKMIKNWLYN